MNCIRQYLCREAEKITKQSLANLPKSKEEWIKQRPKRVKCFLEMMGILNLPPKEERPPLHMHVTSTLDRGSYRIENLYYESLPRLYVTANLYLPKVRHKVPAVVYLCGHSPNAKVHYQAHARHFAKLGFATIILDTLQFGEIQGYHHGCYKYGWFHWYSMGYTPGGVELWNAIRAVDLLEERPEVDAERIGATGISGGGRTSWWLGAVDERVQVIAPVCSTGTLEAHIKYRTIDGDCDCMHFINIYGWDLTDVAALIAPRPLLICSADRDDLYPIDAIKEVYEKIRKVYKLFNCEENVQLVTTPGPHSYHSLSRKAIFAWFLRHLKGLKVSAEEVEDLSEENLEPEENLSVFKKKPPADERNTIIHEDFIPLAKPPTIKDPNDLRREREKLTRILLEKTFAHFPNSPCSLEPEVEMEWEGREWKYSRISFTPEDGWRIVAKLSIHKNFSEPFPVIIYLLSADGHRWEAASFLAGFNKRWARLEVELRGVGESSWAPNLSWHVRRASAAIGRTIASMRIYDALRTLDLVKEISGLNSNNVMLCGRGEMAVVALYTALLAYDNISAIVLSNPPATHNMPSLPDGTGPAIELLNVLRYTDLPYVAGLLWPTEIVFVGYRPPTYKWAEELYAKLGSPGRISRVKKLADWYQSSITDF